MKDWFSFDNFTFLQFSSLEWLSVCKTLRLFICTCIWVQILIPSCEECAQSVSIFLLLDQHKRLLRAQTENIKKQKLHATCKAKPRWEVSKPLPLRSNIFSPSPKCPLTVCSLSIRVLHRSPPRWELWPETSRPRYSMAAVQTEQESWGKWRGGRKQENLLKWKTCRSDNVHMTSREKLGDREHHLFSLSNIAPLLF